MNTEGRLAPEAAAVGRVLMGEGDVGRSLTQEERLALCHALRTPTTGAILFLERARLRHGRSQELLASLLGSPLQFIQEHPKILGEVRDRPANAQGPELSSEEGASKFAQLQHEQAALTASLDASFRELERLRALLERWSERWDQRVAPQRAWVTDSEEIHEVETAR